MKLIGPTLVWLLGATAILAVLFFQSAVMEMLMLGFFTAIAVGITYICTSPRPLRRFIRPALCALVAIAVIAPHAWMSLKLSHCKRELAATNLLNPRSLRHPTYQGKDVKIKAGEYSHRLNAVLVERDHILRKYHFVRWGDWNSSMDGPEAASFYIYMGTLYKDTAAKKVAGIPARH